MIEIVAKSSKETKKAGMALGQILGRESLSDRAFIIALEGDLGSGKTTFIQGLAQGLEVKENILSPTFVIQKDFSLALKNYKNLYHIDAYRLTNGQELIDIGINDWLGGKGIVTVIEWADRVKKILPKKRIKIKIDFGKKENERRIKIKHYDANLRI